MNDQPLRIGLVGCGSIAQAHAAAIAQLPDAALTRFADVKIERAEAMAARYGGAAHPSLSAMLQAGDLDVLHICTPHDLHAGMIEQGLAEGLYVFTEKPPVICRAELDRLLSLPGIERVGVCLQNRWNPATARAQAVIASGELGAPVGIRAFVTWARGASYYLDSGWRGDWKTEGGGALINQSVHTLDLMILLMGMPDDCRCIMTNAHLNGVIQVEDTAAIYLKFGARPGLMYASTAYAVDAPVLIEVECERGAVRIEGTDVGVRQGGAWTLESCEEQRGGAKSYWGNGHLRCIEAFYRCVKRGEAFPTSLRAVVPTVDAMLKCYEQRIPWPSAEKPSS